MRRLGGPFLRLAAALGFLLPAILSGYLGLQRMPDPPLALAAYAMPDGTLPTICDGGGGHRPAPCPMHCPACLVAASPGLLVTPSAVGPARATLIAVAEVPAGVSLPQGPRLPCERARAPPAISFV